MIPLECAAVSQPGRNITTGRGKFHACGCDGDGSMNNEVQGELRYRQQL